MQKKPQLYIHSLISDKLKKKNFNHLLGFLFCTKIDKNILFFSCSSKVDLRLGATVFFRKRALAAASGLALRVLRGWPPGSPTRQRDSVVVLEGRFTARQRLSRLLYLGNVVKDRHRQGHFLGLQLSLESRDPVAYFCLRSHWLGCFQIRCCFQIGPSH